MAPGNLQAAENVIWVDQAAGAGGASGSAEAPFVNLSSALAAAVPGSTVVVRAGVYREQVSVPSGTQALPITVRAANGEHVVLSGMDRVTGWQAMGNGVYRTTIGWSPTALFMGAEQLTQARHPDSGWWTIDAVSSSQFTDAALKGLQAPLVGGQFFAWKASGNIQATYTITDFNKTTGTVTYSGPDASPAAGDLYWLENDEALVSRTGEWSVRPDGNQYRLVVKVPDPAALAAIEAPRRDEIIRLGSHVVLSGFTIEGAVKYGVFLQSRQNTVISDNIIARNSSYAVWLRDAAQVEVSRNVVQHNLFGINLHTVTGALIEQNDIGYNSSDGLRLTWGTSDVTVRQNYIHHHLLWAHPDGFQTFRDVSDVLLEDNLILANGQGLMTEQTQGFVMRGNAVVGSNAYLTILHTDDVTLENGTYAYSGYGLLRMTASNYQVSENVFMVGHSKVAYGLEELSGYQANRNLLWNSQRATNPHMISSGGTWYQNWNAYQATTSQDQQSVYANPQFVNAPIAYDAVVTRDATADTLPLRNYVALFQVGDHVEVNFDGVVRTVVSIQNNALKISPALETTLTGEGLVTNWGANTNFTLDLRLKATSPGAGLSATGGPVGATLSIPAYQAGDFNNDGIRDLPELGGGVRRDSIFGVLSDGRIFVSASDGSQFATSQWGTMSAATNWQDLVVGDFNGDGDEDLAARDAATGLWTGWIANGNRFTSQNWAGRWSPHVTWEHVQTGDFDGNGRDDIIGRAPSGAWYVALSDGSQFDVEYVAAWTTETTWTDVNAGDFNGDGRTDIAGRAGSGTWAIVQSQPGGGHANIAAGRWSPNVTWHDVAVGDFNNDGRSDIIGRAGTGSWWAAYGSAGAFLMGFVGSWSTNTTWSDVSVGDFNGDGQSDIVGRTADGRWYIFRAGDDHATTGRFQMHYAIDWSSLVSWSDVRVGDFDGNGTSDIAGRSDSGKWVVTLSSPSGFVSEIWAAWNTNSTWAHVGSFSRKARAPFLV